jgi:hypothetical protein
LSWYYAPVALFAGLIFWSGVQHVSSRLGSRRSAGSVSTITLALALALITLVVTVRSEAAKPRVAIAHRQAGLWLRDHAQPDLARAQGHDGRYDAADGGPG